MKKLPLLITAAFIMASQMVSAQLTVSSDNTFGRIFDLNYDKTNADKIYAATLTNHIVVSNDNGVTWDVLYSMPLALGHSISQLKISADGSALTFAIRGDQAAVAVFNLASKTIVKSYVMPNAADQPWINSYDFSPQDSNILIVDTNWKEGVGGKGKAFITKNGGTAWKEIYFTEDNDKVFLYTVAIDPVNSDKIFLLRSQGSLGVNGGLLTSTDGGDNFIETFNGITLKPIAFNPNNSNDIYIGTGYNYEGSEQLYRSTDGGTSWNAVPINWNNTGVSNDLFEISINPLNNYVYVLEEDEVAISKDNGATWTKKEYEVDNMTDYYYGLNISFNPVRENELVIGQNYKPLISKDAGETFKNITTPYFSYSGRLSMHEGAGAKHLYYGVQYGFVHKDLTTQVETEHDLRPLNMVSNASPLSIYADSYTEGRIFKYIGDFFMGSSLWMSSDHGETFQILESNYSVGMLDLKNDLINHNQIWASFLENDEAKVIKINVANPDSVEITPINLPSTTAVYKLIHTDTTSDELMILVQSKLYKTTDGGANWTNITSGLSELENSDMLFDIAQNPFNRNELSMASSIGIFSSSDGGQTWAQKTTVEVRKINYSDTANGNLVAANLASQTSDFTLYYSSDHANTWTKVDADKVWDVNTSIMMSDFTGNSATVYLGTSDLGLASYHIDFSKLGVANPSTASNITVYPNPTSGQLNVSTDIQSATVYDFTGRQVATSKSSEMNLSHLNKGVYLLKIITKDNKEVSRKVIKK